MPSGRRGISTVASTKHRSSAIASVSGFSAASTTHRSTRATAAAAGSAASSPVWPLGQVFERPEFVHETNAKSLRPRNLLGAQSLMSKV